MGDIIQAKPGYVPLGQWSEATRAKKAARNKTNEDVLDNFNEFKPRRAEEPGVRRRPREEMNPVYQRPYSDAGNRSLAAQEAGERRRGVEQGRERQLRHESQFDIIQIKDRRSGSDVQMEPQGGLGRRYGPTQTDDAEKPAWLVSEWK